MADPGSSQNAKCLLCPHSFRMPFGRVFSIGEGFCAIEKHSKTKKHVEAFENRRENNEEPEPEQINIEDAFRNQEALTEKERREKSQLLKSQILFSNFVRTHLLKSSHVSLSCYLVYFLTQTLRENGVRATKA